MSSYMYGEDFLGTKFKDTKVGSFFRKVGKITAPVTTKIAETLVGKELTNMAAKIDPTKTPPVPVPGNSTPQSTADTKKDLPLPLIIGGVGVLLVVLMAAKK